MRTTICSECGRESTRIARTLCGTCYSRRKYQNKPFPPKERFTAAEHFEMARAGKGPDDCWEWQGVKCGGTTSSGLRYGAVLTRIDGKRQTTTAHRVALERKLGRVLRTDEKACHTCDNPPCVNPVHLYAGSSKDNSSDAVRRGRTARKFTDEELLEVLRLSTENNLGPAEIARRMGMSATPIAYLVRVPDWKPGQTRPRLGVAPPGRRLRPDFLTHCAHGHLRTPENTYIQKAYGSMNCRDCTKDRDRARRARKKREAA